MKRPVYDFPLEVRLEIAKGIDKENKDYNENFVQIPVEPLKNLIDRNGTPQILLKAFRNHKFCVQVYDNGNWIRISVNRTDYDPHRNVWCEGITWDELMEIKRATGFADKDAIEIYPKDEDIVDISNMRHLFLAKDGTAAPDCIWRQKGNNSK